MKRLREHLAALIQTPFMSALCIAALMWLTWTCSRGSGDGFGNWLAQSVGLDTADATPQGRSQSSFASVVQQFIVEDAGEVSLVDGEKAQHHPRILAALYIRTGTSQSGAFAVTRVVDSVSATVINFDPSLSRQQRREYVLKQCDSQEELRKFRGAFAPGLTTTQIDRSQLSGYAINLLTIAVFLLFMWSLAWAWRGVRLPWGHNAAWRRAAQAQGGIWGRTLTTSPWTTLLCGTRVWLLVMTYLRPFTSWMMRVRQDFVLQTYPGLTPNPMMQMLYSSNASVADIRASFRTSLRIMNIRFALLEDKGTWLAPMWTASEPLLEFTNSPDTASRRAQTEQLVLPTLAITPTAAAGLWVAPQPRRMLPDGVYYNAILLAFGMIAVYSMRWTWEGVVWPWQWKRLRQGVCVKCGYSLAGISGVQCPECGNARNNLDVIQAPQQ